MKNKSTFHKSITTFSKGKQSVYKIIAVFYNKNGVGKSTSFFLWHIKARGFNAGDIMTIREQ